MGVVVSSRQLTSGACRGASCCVYHALNVCGQGEAVAGSDPLAQGCNQLLGVLAIHGAEKLLVGVYFCVKALAENLEATAKKAGHRWMYDSCFHRLGHGKKLP